VAANTTSIQLFQHYKTELTSGKTLPVYFFCGDETFYTDALQDIILDLMPAELRDFNLDILYGSEHTVDKVLGLTRSYPMMADRRIVILRDFSALFDRASSKNDDEEGSGTKSSSGSGIDIFLNYIDNPNPLTLLAIIDKKVPAGNTRLGKSVSKNPKVGYARFDSIPEEQLPAWITDWTTSHFGKKIKPDASQLLARLTGSDLLLVSTELDKLCTFKNTSEEILVDDVRKLVAPVREISVFELKEALFSKNMAKSLSIAEQILYTSKSTDVGEVIRIVSFFYSVFSNIWQIQRLTQKGLPSAEIRTSIGVNSDWYFRNLVKDSKVFPPDHMPQIFEALLDADRSVKGMSKMQAKDILIITIKRIIG
jgi:DNA polymerase III subunit delta